MAASPDLDDYSGVNQVLGKQATDLITARRITRVPTAFISKVPDSEHNPSSLSTLRYDVGTHTDDQGIVGAVVVALESVCNLLEPFNRIRTALSEGIKAGASPS